MTWILVAGAMAGAGVLLLVSVLVRPPVPGAAAVARLDAGRRRARRDDVLVREERLGTESMRLRRLGAPLRSALERRGIQLPGLRADLSVTGSSLEAHLANSVLCGVAATVIPLIVLVLGTVATGSLWATPLWASIVFGVVGSLLPTLQLRQQAVARRRDFRHVFGSFLDLVAMNLAGGRGVPEALQSASAISDAWAMVRLRGALENSRLQGVTPWHAMGELGHEIDVDELIDLAAALALVAEDGAKVRDSLAARAESLRRKELADLEGRAQERSQSMLVAQLLLCAGFLIFLIYPAIARIANP